MNNQSDQLELEPVNLELEIALTKIARALFDYTKSQTDYVELGRLNIIMDAWREAADDYDYRTDGLKVDLTIDLLEWADFKDDLLSPEHDQLVREGKSNIDQAFVESYGKTPEEMIRYLESKLGLTE